MQFTQDFLMWAGSVLAGLIFLLMGWVFKMVFGLIEDLQDGHVKVDKSLSDHKLHAAETFATKSEVDKGFDRVMRKLDAMDKKDDENQRLLNAKIDTKADKK